MRYPTGDAESPSATKLRTALVAMIPNSTAFTSRITLRSKAKSYDISFMSGEAITLFAACLAELLKQKKENTSCTLKGFM